MHVGLRTSLSFNLQSVFCTFFFVFFLSQKVFFLSHCSVALHVGLRTLLSFNLQSVFCIFVILQAPAPHSHLTSRASFFFCHTTGPSTSLSFNLQGDFRFRVSSTARKHAKTSLFKSLVGTGDLYVHTHTPAYFSHKSLSLSLSLSLFCTAPHLAKTRRQTRHTATKSVSKASKRVTNATKRVTKAVTKRVAKRRTKFTVSIRRARRHYVPLHAIYDDVTYVYDDVTYVCDDVTYVYDDVIQALRPSTFGSACLP